MRYFFLSLRLSLRERLRSGRFWCALVLILAAGIAARWTGQAEVGSAVQVGAVIPSGAEAFREALESRSGQPVSFIFTDEAEARKKVASGQWDCALLLPDNFAERLESGRQTGLITLITGPGSTVYPLVREAAAAALLKITSGQMAADYLLSSGIADGTFDAAALPQIHTVQINMETLDGQPLDQLSLAGKSLSRVLRGSLAAALLVWALFAAVDLGRWRQTGSALRMRPCLGGIPLALPRLTAALIPAFILGAAGIAAGGEGWRSVLALIPYLAALGALDLLLSTWKPIWEALPAVIPFAATSVFVLSPVFVDAALLFPALSPVCRWMPVTLYLYGCEGNWGALCRLIGMAAVFALAAILLESLQNRRKTA